MGSQISMMDIMHHMEFMHCMYAMLPHIMICMREVKSDKGIQ